MNSFEFRRRISPEKARRAIVAQQAIALPRPQNPPVGRLYFRPRSAKKPNPLWQRLQLVWLVLAALVGSFIAQTLVIGVALLAVYAVVALVLRIPSRTTFTLAFMLLVAISILLLVKPNPQLANNFATYTFVLLIIGVVSLGRESRMPKRRKHFR